MNKKYYFLTTLFAFILLPLICSADVAVPRTEMFLAVFMIDFVVNAIVLIVCYLIIKEISKSSFSKFFIYILLVTIAGSLIDLIGTTSGRWVYAGFLIFILLFLFNYWFSRKLMRLTPRRALFIGLVMAIITNPVLWVPFIDPLLMALTR